MVDKNQKHDIQQLIKISDSRQLTQHEKAKLQDAAMHNSKLAQEVKRKLDEEEQEDMNIKAQAGLEVGKVIKQQEEEATKAGDPFEILDPMTNTQIPLTAPDIEHNDHHNAHDEAQKPKDDTKPIAESTNQQSKDISESAEHVSEGLLGFMADLFHEEMEKQQEEHSKEPQGPTPATSSTSHQAGLNQGQNGEKNQGPSAHK